MSDNASETTKPGETPISPEPPIVRPASTPKERFDPLRLTWLAILLLVIGAAFLIIATRWSTITGAGGPPQTSAAVQTEQALAELRRNLAALQGRLDAADTRLGALENKEANAPPSAAALADLMTRAGAGEARLTKLESGMARTADKDLQAALQARVTRLEADNRGTTLKRAAGTLALSNLARAAESSAPFKLELDALAGIEPDEPAIQSLQSYAPGGVPTLEMLRARFPDAARAALDAERTGAAGDNFFARIWASLLSLISVRRVGEVEGNATGDRLARAEAALGRGDLSRAVAEAQSVTGAGAAFLAPWLKDATARLAVDRALADIGLRIVQALAAQPPDAPSAVPGRGP
jgi:hypothetical protein